MNKIYNFSAGPSMIPTDVLIQYKKEFYNWKNLGVSIIEISHRSFEFTKMINECEENLRFLMNIPSNYHVLFFSGGARAQFSAIPMNLIKSNEYADYICSGYWSQAAFLEAKKYCLPKKINIVKINNNIKDVLPSLKWKLNKKSSYIHYCPNETLEGIEIKEEPNFSNKIIIGDFSSTILSRCIDINKYGLIYASAQKNISTAGITLVIIRKDLVKDQKSLVPSFLNYKVAVDNQSMFNTPATFSWYLASLVFKWLIKKGGIKKIEKENEKKAKLLYEKIDDTDFYYNNISKKYRSFMNISFYLKDEKLNEVFLKEAFSHGLYALKGHYIVGGMRASIYNAMPIKGIQKLISFMTYFEKKYR
ncbi:3-phosphoserine/phosphohydroxythreonine transaminase [Buchnera aphidicola (Mindarus keteleerifoliae)]|uniref:3-phosphoserine/phosphohydroxythreonine transaminase n=1 Tax=Buchnera aphidicola TaxID=9 RepID=UPI0031B70EEC